MDGNNPGPLVVSTLAICSRLRNLRVMKFSRMKTLVLPLKVSSYQAIVTKRIFFVSHYCRFISSLKIPLFLFFLIDTCRHW